jgi:hypothetical protein
MWILKGMFLGLWLIGFGTMVSLYFDVYRHMPPQSAVGITVITACTTRNPLWCTGLVACFLLGSVITRLWPVPRMLWMGLIVTGLIPGGLLAIFLTLLVKLKQISEGP